MAKQKQPYTIHLVMLSRFGKSDGGMETWAHQFIPLLLQHDKNASIHVFGIDEGQAKVNEADIRRALRKTEQSRLTFTFFPCKKSRIPFFFQMFTPFYRYRSKLNQPELVLGVGGMFELAMITLIPRYKHVERCLWFRTLFFNQGKKKIPAFSIPFLKKLEIHLLKKVNHLLANGQDIADYYAKYGLHVDVIYNAVDTKKWNGTLPAAPSPLHVAFIGRLTKVKGIDAFYETVKTIKESPQASEFVFHLLGADDTGQAIALHENQQVVYHGQVSHSELPKKLQQFHVCVALTYADPKCGGGGMSNALLEQMSAGKIIIAWDNIIFRQLLNERSAYLIPEHDVTHLTKTLLSIPKDYRKAEAKAEQAKLKALEFSADEHIGKFARIIL